MDAAAALPARVRDRVRWLSLTPFDQTTAEGRAQERHRRVALTAAAAALAKLLSVGSTLISLPLTLHYLGAERFGMWATISSLVVLLSFADFGIANGVLSAVASAHGKDDQRGIRNAITSGFFVLSAVAAAILIAFAVAYTFVPWHAIFNVQTALARAEAGPALAVFMVCFAANVPLGVVQRAQFGLQQGFVVSLFQCVGSLAALLAVLTTIHLEGGLPWLVLALAGMPVLAAGLNSVYFFARSRPDLRLRLSEVTRATCRQIAGTGALFFVLQVVVAVAFTSDSIVIAQLLGASEVATYAVPEKLFGLISMVIAMVLAPLWPAYGEAISRGDADWVRRTLKRSLGSVVVVAAVCGAALVLLGPAILQLWVGNAVAPMFSLMLALAIWKVVESAGGAVAMYMNGAGVLRLQVYCAVPTAILAILLKIQLIPAMGVSGAVIATIIAYVLCAGIPLGIFVSRVLRSKVLVS